MPGGRIVSPPTQGRVPVEWAGGMFVPVTSSVQAKLVPLFKTAFQTGGVSSQTISLTVPSLTAGTSTVLSTPVALSINNFPTGFTLDAGQSATIVATATLLDQPTGLIVSAPALAAPVYGWNLTGPLSVGNIATTLKVSVYSPGATTGATLTVTVTAHLAGAS